MQGIPGHKKANVPQGQYVSCGVEMVLLFPALLNILNTMKKPSSHWSSFLFFMSL